MLEVARFLAQHPPFAGLTAGVVEHLAGSTQVEFFQPGDMILEAGGEAAAFVYVVRRGSVDVSDAGRVVDRLEEGDVFGFVSLFSGEPPSHDVTAHEETICYLLDPVGAQEAFAAPAGLSFLSTVGESHAGQRAVGLDVVGDLPLAELLELEAGSSAGDAARAMTAAGVTAAVVVGPEGRGIVTDRDIRARIVASGVDASVAVESIASFPLVGVGHDEPVDVALEQMLSMGVHHLGVERGGAIVGILSDLDLLRRERRDAFLLRSEIDRASSVADVGRAGLRIPQVVAPLVRTGVDARHIGVVVAALTDALVAKLLVLAQADLGQTEAPFAWLALGSCGRREQALSTDQDHAVVFTDGADEQHFVRLGQFVADGLALAGIPRCSSRVMAAEEGWHGSETWWRIRLADWMKVAEPKATFLTGVAFDARRVVGSLDVTDLFAAAARDARRSPRFLRRLARLVVDMEIPVGFLGGLVTHDDGERDVLDVKHGGIHPITEMARLFALEAGSRSLTTPGRLSDAAGSGIIDDDRAASLTEAYELLSDMRLVHQVDQVTSGIAPDNLIDPKGLSQFQRRSLRDAFRVIRQVQREFAERTRPRVGGH